MISAGGSSPMTCRLPSSRLLVAPAVDFDLDHLGQLAAEVFDVYACAAIDLRRILPRDQPNPHPFSPIFTFCACNNSIMARSVSVREAVYAGLQCDAG